MPHGLTKLWTLKKSLSSHVKKVISTRTTSQVQWNARPIHSGVVTLGDVCVSPLSHAVTLFAINPYL